MASACRAAVSAPVQSPCLDEQPRTSPTQALALAGWTSVARRSSATAAGRRSARRLAAGRRDQDLLQQLADGRLLRMAREQRLGGFDVRVGENSSEAERRRISDSAWARSSGDTPSGSERDRLGGSCRRDRGEGGGGGGGSASCGTARAAGFGRFRRGPRDGPAVATTYRPDDAAASDGRGQHQHAAAPRRRARGRREGRSQVGGRTRPARAELREDDAAARARGAPDASYAQRGQGTAHGTQERPGG